MIQVGCNFKITYKAGRKGNKLEKNRDNSVSTPTNGGVKRSEARRGRGQLLSTALMTFGKQRVPSALEERERISYKAQAANLILDHGNEIDTICETANSLIFYRNPWSISVFE